LNGLGSAVGVSVNGLGSAVGVSRARSSRWTMARYGAQSERLRRLTLLRHSLIVLNTMTRPPSTTP
jgi:hypothetical protein